MIKIGLGLPGQNFYTSSNGYAIAFSTVAERSAKFENGAFKELNKKWRQLEIPAGTLFSIQTLPGLVKKWTPERQPGIGTIFSLSGACRNIQFKSGRNIVSQPICSRKISRAWDNGSSAAPRDRSTAPALWRFGQA